jgi:ABC-type multidrug transport system ATPase subunit
LGGNDDAPVQIESFVHVEPVTISWRDMQFSVTTTAKQSDGGQIKTHKQILNSVSGVVKPGEMLAICGPSGSGKTTLLDAIAGRIDAAKRGRTLTGSVHLNGVERQMNRFKQVASYVQQEHALQTPFTVRETMGYAADLLLPHEKFGRAERKKMIEDVISALGLVSCADTIVGDVFRKGLSGGQLRRLSIAIELIGNPSIILLDEPTSGLDSSAAENIMAHLGALARSGRTVICTIHQPPSEVWEDFDKFCLLSEGKCLYFGPASDSVSYFAGRGYQCPEYTNPADYFLRLSNTDFKGHADVNKLWREFPTTPQGSALQEELSRALQPVASSPGSALSSTYRNGFLSQLLTLSHRAFMNNARNPGIFLVRLIMYFGLGMMVGFMFWDLGNKYGASDIVSRVSLLFYVAAFLVFMSVAVLPFFIQERHVFLRERSNGWYSVPAYVLATWLMSLPGLALISIVSTILVVLPAQLNGFGVFFLDLFLSLVAAEGFMALIGSVVPHYIIGIALGAAVYGFFMLCEGFLIVRSDIPGWFIWGHYIAFHTYSFRPFMVNEFQSIKKFDSPQFPDGPAVIEFYEMDGFEMWEDLLILFSYAIAFQLIYGAILQFFHTGKR